MSQNQAYQSSKFVRSTIEAIVNLFNKLKKCNVVYLIQGSPQASLSINSDDFFYNLLFDQDNNIKELSVGNRGVPFNGKKFTIENLKEENGEIQCDHAGIWNETSNVFESTLKCDKDNLDTILLDFNKFMELAALLDTSAPPPSSGSSRNAGPTPQTSQTSSSNAGPTTQTPTSAPTPSSGSSSNAGPSNPAPTPTPSSPRSLPWLGGAAVISGGLCYAGYKARQAQAQKTKNSESTATVSSKKPLKLKNS